MDSLTIIGFMLGVTAILAGQYIDGGQLSMLLNVPALIIVLGGTFGAVLLESPHFVFKRALEIFPWVIFPPDKHYYKDLKNIIHWSILARNEGMLSLEKFLTSDEISSYTRRGLQLIVDGHSSDVIRDIMMHELDVREVKDLQAARVFESMGGYSPTIGIIGAVLGLIHILGSLNKPELLGPGIAVAFVATIYGVAFANIFCIPVSKKLKNQILNRTIQNSMIMEGICAIAKGEHPQAIEYKLLSYVSDDNAAA
ncbi:flagellar motor protein [Candidatus Berkiella cookevillensis]|uniref:Chemotaxis protein PomA n=1 Tax=Candidatus Berkiella cookevillensis TaxID=437022 RepID=A0A0Q9YQ65_9GAMM|nr:flagellar motor protein [Candidatus Berkiella cookevillensis]MCS5708592.1 flagellar motor protein [Candidatus Berkiella cookevillensis]